MEQLARELPVFWMFLAEYPMYDPIARSRAIEP